MSRHSYKVDLRALHALCEANYARLLRLFPGYEVSNSLRFTVGASQVAIEVLERSRYTTLFAIRSFAVNGATNVSANGAANGATNGVTSSSGRCGGSRPDHDAARDAAPGLGPLSIEVRAYHDASMLEVVRFQSAQRTAGRYDYPNPSMHQQDEKLQQNSFLADWLTHSMNHGEATLPDLLKLGKATA